MSSFTISKVINIPEASEESGGGDEEIETLAGFLSETKLSWLAYGGHIEFIDNKNGTRITEYTFGALLKDATTKIICVAELLTAFKEVTMVAVGLECTLSGGMVCIFDIFSRRVLRALQIPEKVTSLHVVNNGNENSSFPGPLSAFDGALAVGTLGGNVFIIDLCRQIIDEVRTIGSGSIELKDEIDPCQLLVLPGKEMDRIDFHMGEAERSGNHLAVHINALETPTPYFVLKGPKGDDRIHVNKEEVCISALHYASQLSSLLVGYNFGALQIWDLIKMKLIYTSPVYEENIPVSHFAIQEPVDDPRSFCYFWAVYSNTEPYLKGFPVAALYALSYESKDWHDGYGYIYQNFQSCAIRFQVDLGTFNKVEKALGAHCLRLQAFNKGINKNAGNVSLTDTPEESYTLCLMVWNIWCQDRTSSTHMNLFDLNQWYKEQMPSVSGQQCRTYMTNVNVSNVLSSNLVPIMDIQINSATITQFVGAQRLEEHYYPSSIGYECRTITKLEVTQLKNRGLQRQLFYDLESAGPLALMKPSELFENTVFLGLTPLFMDSHSAQSLTLTYQREQLLSVGLEHGMESWLCKCASSWSNGSHRAVGLSLDLLLGWAWKRANSLKNNADRISVSLFDHSESKLDTNANNLLNNCRSQIFILRNVYSYIYKKCFGFLIDPDISKEQLNCLDRIYSYLDVLGWLINVGLLPECAPTVTLFDDDKIVVPYPAKALREYYKDRRASLHVLKRKKNFNENGAALYIDKLVEMAGSELIEKEWQCDGGSGKYPPPSLQALLRTYLVENIPIEQKHTIVTYIFLDLAMALDQEKYQVVIPTLIKFPGIFQLSTSTIKLTQALWQLDRGELGTATEQLVDPIIKSDDISDWQHKIILQALMLQDQHKLARLYLKVRQPPLKQYEDVCLAIKLHIANRMLHEAFTLYRMYSGSEGGNLLGIIFKECNRTDQMNNLLKLNFARNEEESLLNFMNQIEYEHQENFKSIYFMQRGRFLDFYQMQDRRRNANFDDNDIGKQITDSLDEMMPHFKRSILGACAFERVDLFNEVDNTKPKPLSVFLHNTREHVKYQSNFLKACISKAKDAWSESTKPTTDHILDEDIPFLRAPQALSSRKRANPDLIYPQIITTFQQNVDAEEEETASPSKRMKFSPDSELVVLTPQEKSAKKIHKMTHIETPIVKRKSPVKGTPMHVDKLATPQSILKARIQSPSPSYDRGNSTTPEFLDDIDSTELGAPLISSTMVAPLNQSRPSSGLGITPRKALRTTVRFSGIPSTNTSSSTNVSQNSAENRNSLNINPLPDIIDNSADLKVDESGKNSSVSTTDTYYSPEMSFEEIDNDKSFIEANKILRFANWIEPVKNPIPGSPISRKSYQTDTVTATEVRSSPRLRASPQRELSQDSSDPPQFSKRLLPRRSLIRKVLENSSKNAFPSISAKAILGDITDITLLKGDKTGTVPEDNGNTDEVFEKTKKKGTINRCRSNEDEDECRCCKPVASESEKAVTRKRVEYESVPDIMEVDRKLDEVESQLHPRLHVYRFCSSSMGNSQGIPLKVYTLKDCDASKCTTVKPKEYATESVPIISKKPEEFNEAESVPMIAKEPKESNEAESIPIIAKKPMFQMDISGEKMDPAPILPSITSSIPSLVRLQDEYSMGTTEYSETEPDESTRDPQNGHLNKGDSYDRSDKSETDKTDPTNKTDEHKSEVIEISSSSDDEAKPVNVIYKNENMDRAYHSSGNDGRRRISEDYQKVQRKFDPNTRKTSQGSNTEPNENSKQGTSVVEQQSIATNTSPSIMNSQLSENAPRTDNVLGRDVQELKTKEMGTSTSLPYLPEPPKELGKLQDEQALNKIAYELEKEKSPTQISSGKVTVKPLSEAARDQLKDKTENYGRALSSAGKEADKEKRKTEITIDEPVNQKRRTTTQSRAISNAADIWKSGTIGIIVDQDFKRKSEAANQRRSTVQGPSGAKRATEERRRTETSGITSGLDKEKRALPVAQGEKEKPQTELSTAQDEQETRQTALSTAQDEQETRQTPVSIAQDEQEKGQTPMSMEEEMEKRGTKTIALMTDVEEEIRQTGASPGQEETGKAYTGTNQQEDRDSEAVEREKRPTETIGVGTHDSPLIVSPKRLSERIPKDHGKCRSSSRSNSNRSSQQSGSRTSKDKSPTRKSRTHPGSKDIAIETEHLIQSEITQTDKKDPGDIDIDIVVMNKQQLEKMILASECRKKEEQVVENDKTFIDLNLEIVKVVYTTEDDIKEKVLIDRTPNSVTSNQIRLEEMIAANEAVQETCCNQPLCIANQPATNEGTGEHQAGIPCCGCPKPDFTESQAGRSYTDAAQKSKKCNLSCLVRTSIPTPVQKKTPEPIAAGRRTRSSSIRSNQSPPRQRSSSPKKSSAASSPTNSRVLRQRKNSSDQVNSPAPARRSTRRSSATSEPTNANSMARTSTRTTSISDTQSHATPGRRTVRAKSEDTDRAAVKTKRVSANLPAIEEENKLRKAAGTTIPTQTGTKHPKDLQEIDLESIDPIVLLDREDFKGDADPDEAKILKASSPNQSISEASDTNAAVRNKRVSTDKNETADVSTPMKKKKGISDGAEQVPLRRGRSASVEEPPITPTNSRTLRTRRSSQDSMDSDVSTNSRMRTRSKASKSEKDSDSEVDTSSKRGRKKQIAQKSELEQIVEESNQDSGEEVVKARRGRPRKNP